MLIFLVLIFWLIIFKIFGVKSSTYHNRRGYFRAKRQINRMRRGKFI